MSTTVNESTPQDLAIAIIADEEIRKLPAGSDEYAAAVDKLQKSGSTEKKTTTAAVDAPKVEDEISSETDEDKSETKKSSKTGLERRFSELTGERDEARQQARALEARLQALEAKGGTPEQIEKFSENEFDKEKPKVDDFDTYGEYQEALVDWKLEKKDFDREQRRVIDEVSKLQHEVVGSWNTREKATKARVEGYDQLVDSDFISTFTSGVASKEAMQFLLESEAGPDVLFELADDGDKLKNFKSMSAVRQVAYLSKLEDKYSEEEEDTPAPVKVSKAPAPPKGLPSGKSSTVVKDFPTTGGSFADFMKWRERDLK